MSETAVHPALMCVLTDSFISKCSVSSSNYKAICWKHFDRVVEPPQCGNRSKQGGLKGSVICKFEGVKLAYHGATTMMKEPLKCKHLKSIKKLKTKSMTFVLYAKL